MQQTQQGQSPNPAKSEPVSAVVTSMEEQDNSQFVTFYIGEECFAFDMSVVQEIIWVPETVKVPLTPPSFLGLANLRGNILPVVDLRIILNCAANELTDASRVIIIDCGQPVGLVVDRVDRVIQVEPDQIEPVTSHQENIQADCLSGVIKQQAQGQANLIQLLDGQKITAREFTMFTASQSTALDTSRLAEIKETEAETEDEDDERQLVSFYLDNQEYAFEIARLKEIVRLPEEIHEVPNSDPNLMGIVSYRNQMLPLVNLNAMLGLNSHHDPEQSRVLVMTLQDSNFNASPIGLVVDKVHEILKIAHEQWEPVPELIAQQTQNNEIKAVCRLNQGKRIVSVLSLKNMFAHPGMEAALAASQEYQEKSMQEVPKEQLQEHEEDEIQLVTFKLADEEYGILIENIQEIILIPEEINVVPRTPEYIEGMINLRGTVLPVIDMRKRLGMDAMSRQDSQRIIVLNIRGIKTGFIVDAVTEVLCVPKNYIEHAPKLSSEQANLMDKVINLREQKRIILIISTDKLLNEEELAEIQMEQQEH